MMSPEELERIVLKENDAYFNEWLENLDKYVTRELQFIKKRLEYLETEIQKLKQQLKVK